MNKDTYLLQEAYKNLREQQIDAEIEAQMANGDDRYEFYKPLSDDRAKEHLKGIDMGSELANPIASYLIPGTAKYFDPDPELHSSSSTTKAM